MATSIWNQITLLSAMCVIVFSVGIDEQTDCTAILHKCPNGTDDSGKICGNDNRNYDSTCHLLRRSCKMDLPHLKKFYDGKCVDHLKMCPRICESGTRTSKVCGSDGRTYTTECAVRRRRCRLGSDLTVAYQGRCRTKEETVENDHRDICSRKCEPGTRTSKVCGSDGRTYATECAARRRRCRLDSDLTVAYQGRCRPKEEVHSKETVEIEVVDERIEKEITGSPFENEEIVVEIIEIDHRDTCSRKCEPGTRASKVCGSDGRTYATECAARRKR
ncbi:follistatin-like [Anneissia japonica]|uniref:follistatin-like n=1 Tax=Anneissia japonica TaxID=1529436 RepID=UPI001425B5DF|nr:follistatin-like [Anneissia japonica]